MEAQMGIQMEEHDLHGLSTDEKTFLTWLMPRFNDLLSTYTENQDVARRFGVSYVEIDRSLLKVGEEVWQVELDKERKTVIKGNVVGIDDPTASVCICCLFNPNPPFNCLKRCC